MTTSQPAEAFWDEWIARGLEGSDIVREHEFCERSWRFDFAFPSLLLAVEIEGMGSSSRHQRFTGACRDMAKYNAAVSMGWRILRYPGASLMKRADLVVQEVSEIICGEAVTRSVIEQLHGLMKR